MLVKTTSESPAGPKTPMPLGTTKRAREKSVERPKAPASTPRQSTKLAPTKRQRRMTTSAITTKAAYISTSASASASNKITESHHHIEDSQAAASLRNTELKYQFKKQRLDVQNERLQIQAKADLALKQAKFDADMIVYKQLYQEWIDEGKNGPKPSIPRFEI
jgi:hypothetical protein